MVFSSSLLIHSSSFCVLSLSSLSRLLFSSLLSLSLSYVPLLCVFLGCWESERARAETLHLRIGVWRVGFMWTYFSFVFMIKKNPHLLLFYSLANFDFNARWVTRLLEDSVENRALSMAHTNSRADNTSYSYMLLSVRLFHSVGRTYYQSP